MENYKNGLGKLHQIALMAQGFHSTIFLNGGDEIHNSVVDDGGFAFAAFLGLNGKLENQHR
jgi:hypothetical protein